MFTFQFSLIRVHKLCMLNIASVPGGRAATGSIQLMLFKFNMRIRIYSVEHQKL